MVKSQHIAIGRVTDTHKEIRLDIPSLVDTRMLIQANSGGGKSYLLRLIAERVAGKIQMIILDPEGEFATLREKVDIALVGQGGEMATDVRAAALLARKLVELRVSAIVDLYDLKLPDRRKFVRLFLESLMNVPRTQWHPLLVVLDEAHLFAPEKSAGESESTAAVIALMSQGRKRGFAGIISTQRLSKLHKDVAAETNNVVIGRTWLDVDQQRAGDLLGMNKQDRQALRDLNPGEFYGFGPALNVNGVARFQSDQVATSHPKAGERHLMEVPRASAAIQEVVQQIGDLPAQAEEEANTLTAAQRRIGELERQLRARPAPPVPVALKPEPVIQRVEIPVFKDGELPRLEAAINRLADTGAQLVTVGNQIAGVGSQVVSAAREVGTSLADVVKAQNRPLPKPAPVRIAPAPRPIARATPAVRSVSAPAGGEVALRSGERKMLQVLASRYPAKYTRAQLGTLAGFTPSGGTFGNYFGTLKRTGLIIESSNGDVEITQAGIDMVGADIPPTPKTTEELLAMWRGALREGERKMLDELVSIYPSSMSRQALGDATGFAHTGGTFGNYLGTLRRNGLIEVDGDRVTASRTLFLE